MAQTSFPSKTSSLLAERAVYGKRGVIQATLLVNSNAKKTLAQFRKLRQIAHIFAVFDAYWRMR